MPLVEDVVVEHLFHASVVLPVFQEQRTSGNPFFDTPSMSASRIGRVRLWKGGLGRVVGCRLWVRVGCAAAVLYIIGPGCLDLLIGVHPEAANGRVVLALVDRIDVDKSAVMNQQSLRCSRRHVKVAAVQYDVRGAIRLVVIVVLHRGLGELCLVPVQDLEIEIRI